MNRELHVPALLRMRRDAGKLVGQLVAGRRVETRGASATVVRVFADEDPILEDRAAGGRRVSLEDNVGVEVPLVEAVEVDLEGAARVGLVVRRIVPLESVDLDGP